MSLAHQPVLPGFPVPPLPQLKQCRSITRTAILQLKHAAIRCGSFEVAALATALEAADDGDLMEAAEALAEAEQMQALGA